MENQLYTEPDYKMAYNKIKEILSSGKDTETYPLATLIGGQPGSGKSELTKCILAENENTISIDGDYIREFHPHIKELQQKYGTNYPEATQPFVNRVVEQLIDELSKERYNLIIEGTLRNINVPMKTAMELNERDYLVELHVIATDKELSWQSTIERGDKMKENGDIPRYVDKGHHDNVVRSLPETVQKLSETDLFYNVMIMTRDQSVLYDKEKTPEKDPKEIMERALDGELIAGIDDRVLIQKNTDEIIAEARNELEHEHRFTKMEHRYDMEDHVDR